MQIYNEKKQSKMLVVFPPVFMVDTKTIFSYNFEVPFNTLQLRLSKSTFCSKSEIVY